MVEVETNIYGIYPKTEDLRKKINKWERGKIDTAEISDALHREKQLYYDHVEERKIHTFTDPLFNWYDILRPVVLLSGGKLGPLTRYKETNTFYRLPEFDEIRDLTKDPTANGGVESNPPFPLYQGADHSGFSAFLPSPVTLYRMSQVSDGLEKKDFIRRITDNYLKICEKFGVKKISLFESFEYNGDDLSFIDRLSKDHDLYLITEGKVKGEIFGGLREKLYSIIVSERGDIGVAGKYSKVPGIKLLDAHNTKLENPESVRKDLDEISKDGDFGKIVVTNSDYYDFLPRSIADKKIDILSQVGE